MDVVKKINFLRIKSLYSLVHFSQIRTGQNRSTVQTADVAAIREGKEMGVEETEEGKNQISTF